MSAIYLPTPGYPPVGENNFTAGPKLNRNFEILDRRTNYTNGSLAKGVHGAGGDSTGGFAGGAQSVRDGDNFPLKSPLFMMRTYHYMADFVLDTRPYYDTELPDFPRIEPASQRGHGFAKGGSEVAHFLEVQVPYILENPPEYLYLSIFQNGKYFLQDGFERFTRDYAQAKEGIQQVLDAGVTIFEGGVLPHSTGAGTKGAQLKHRLDHQMRNWAAKVAGLHYIPFLDALKAFDPAMETSGQVSFKGVQKASGDTSEGDGLHIGPYGAYLMGEIMAPVYQRVMGEFSRPAFDLSPFDASVNPYGNVLGAAGAMVGTGGLFNGSASDNVPAGLEVTYETGSGITLTPRLIERDGKPVFRLEAGAGTSAADANIRIAAPITAAIPDQDMETYARGRWDHAVGWAGIAAGGGFPVRNAAGETRGVNRVLPFALNRPWEILTARPRNFANSAGNRFEIGIDTAFAPNTPTSGALEIEGLWFGRSDNNAPQFSSALVS